MLPILLITADFLTISLRSPSEFVAGCKDASGSVKGLMISYQIAAFEKVFGLSLRTLSSVSELW